MMISMYLFAQLRINSLCYLCAQRMYGRYINDLL